MSKVRPADAHDAGCLGAFLSKVRPADAHDAGWCGALRPNYFHLMLTMPVV